MTCEESVERMSELLDGLPSEALEAHLGGCPSCREGLESMRRADEALRRLPPIEWNPATTEAILRRARRPRRRLLPAAACLVAAALGSILLLPRSSGIPREPLALHVSAVRCLAGQEGVESVDRDVLSSQARQLRLPELVARIARDADASRVRDYLVCSSRPLESPADVARLWSAAEELKGWCSLPDVPARIEPVAHPAPADLYAEGRLHFSNGDPARAVRALDLLLERQPDGPYADPSCVALASHSARSGDDLSALALYASIRKAATITPEIARAIRETGLRAGRAFAGPRPLAEADLDTLRRCAESRTPYGLVRAAHGGRTEFFLLGPLRPELAVTPEAPPACAYLATRLAKVDLAAYRGTDPVVREMLGAMKESAK